MKRLLYFVLLLAMGRQAQTQTTNNTSIYLVETMDGNKFTGTLLNETDTDIVLKTETVGEIKIEKIKIKYMRAVENEEIKSGKIWGNTPQDARYFFAPNGYGLRKGEGYYQNTYLFFNQASYGITDNFTMGFGMIPLFLFDGAPTPVWLTPKIQFPLIKNKLNFGGGALVGTVLGLESAEEGTNSFGIAYGTLTAGSRNSNLSFGLGYGFAGGQWGDYPSFNLSGMVRIGQKWYLVTENYMFDAGESTAGMYSAGARLMFPKCSIDFAIMEAGAEGSYFPIPWLSFAVPFGHAK